MWLKQNAYKLPRVLRSCLVYKLLHIPVNELEKKENYLLNQFFTILNSALILFYFNIFNIWR